LIIQLGTKYVVFSILAIVVLLEIWVILDLVEVVLPSEIIDVEMFESSIREDTYAEVKSIESNRVFSHTCRETSGLTPGCEVYFQGTVVELDTTYIKINSDGYRGQLYPKEKPEGVYRIVVLGDSFTFGQGLNITDTFTHILEEILNNKSNIMNYQVINLGVPGYSLYQNVEILEDKGIDYSPDLLILSYLANDIENETRKEEIFNEAFKESLAPDDLEEREKVLFYIVYSERKHKKEIELMSKDELRIKIHPLLENVNVLSESNNFEIILFIWNDPWDKGVVSEFGEEHGWSIVSTESILEQHENDELILHEMDQHPNALFNIEVAKELYKEITTNIIQ
jgi:hypothetical protein